MNVVPERTEDKFVRLMSMATTYGEHLFARVVVAQEILADKAWIESQHLGDSARALEFVQDKCFPDCYSNGVTLVALFKLLSAFPTIEEWRVYECRAPRMLRVLENRLHPKPTALPKPIQKKEDDVEVTAQIEGKRIVETSRSEAIHHGNGATKISTSPSSSASAAKSSPSSSPQDVIQKLCNENSDLRNENSDLRRQLSERDRKIKHLENTIAMLHKSRGEVMVS